MNLHALLWENDRLATRLRRARDERDELRAVAAEFRNKRDDTQDRLAKAKALADEARKRWHRGVLDGDREDAERAEWDSRRAELDR